MPSIDAHPFQIAPDAPDAPANARVPTVSDTKIILAGDDVADENGYRI